VTDTLILKIDPPLPCAVLDGSRTCDRQACMVYAYPAHGPRPGVWLIMPVCDRCASVGKMVGADDSHDAFMSDAKD
jgi:hypothetical protein